MVGAVGFPPTIDLLQKYRASDPDLHSIGPYRRRGAILPSSANSLKPLTLALNRRRREKPLSDIRPAVASDVPSIRAVVEDAYGHYVERIGRAPAPMTADYERAVGEGEVLVLTVGRTVAGLMVLKTGADHLLVGNVAVAGPTRVAGSDGRSSTMRKGAPHGRASANCASSPMKRCTRTWRSPRNSAGRNMTAPSRMGSVACSCASASRGLNRRRRRSPCEASGSTSP